VDLDPGYDPFFALSDSGPVSGIISGLRIRLLNNTGINSF
jgi:hypothetical protein